MTQVQPEAGEYLTPEELAIALKIHTRTLMRWRHAGTGPIYIRAGVHRILYRRADVRRWAASRTFSSPAAEAAA
jgi:Helix-turn-helix domain